jgi:hypothetical protein
LIDMKKNPEKTAWALLLSAFFIFCALTLIIPSSIYWYAVNATQSLPTELTSVRGIVLISGPNVDVSVSVMDGVTVPLEEQFSVATDSTSQAILTFADDSSLTMYGDTGLVLDTSQQPRFGISSNPSQIVINLQQGRVRVTPSRAKADLQFVVNTPQATAFLNQGSYSIEANEQGTQIISRLGEADVVAAEESIMLQQGQRVVVDPDLSLSPALPAAQNLLTSSIFGNGSSDIWESYTIAPIESVSASADVDFFQGRPVLNLRSEGEDNVHSEVGVVQQVNRDVRDFQSLRLFAEVRLVDQSLPGGGQLGSEFPIMLHIAYTDVDGNDRDWFHGFYYDPPPENFILYDQPDNSSERIARFLWYPYESVNLLTTLGPAKPAYIKSIRIYSSGWLYNAMVANISLLAEE